MRLINFLSYRGASLLMLGLFWSQGLSAQTIKSKKYFPLVEGSRYTYIGLFDKKEYTKAIICQAHTTEEGVKFYYFRETADPNSIIGSNMFGLGSYSITKDGIVNAETFWWRDLAKLDQLVPQLLLPKKFRLQNPPILQLDAGKAQKTVKFLSLEDVSVPQGKYKNCLKVHIKTVWDSGTVYNEYIWLAKGVGMVKWQKTTGRIDELTYFK
ncbi:MAG: hypothetical protein AAF927_01060 [Bacteroidota bacterium]